MWINIWIRWEYNCTDHWVLNVSTWVENVVPSNLNIFESKEIFELFFDLFSSLISIYGDYTCLSKLFGFISCTLVSWNSKLSLALIYRNHIFRCLCSDRNSINFLNNGLFDASLFHSNTKFYLIFWYSYTFFMF